MYYILIFLFFAIATNIVYKNPNTPKYRQLIKIAGAIFVLFAGLRYELGVDFFAYKRHLNESPTFFNFLKDTDDIYFEPGYKLFLSLIKTFTDEVQILLLASSMFCTYILFRFLKEHVPHKYMFLSLLTYFFSTYMLMEMQALRQAMAAGIIYLGYNYLIKDDKRNAFLCVLAAFTFHSSALFFFPIFLFLDKKINYYLQFSLLAVSIVVFVTQIDVISVALERLADIIPNASMALRMATYLGGDANERGVNIMFFVYLTFFIWLCYINHRIKYYDKNKLYIVGHNLVWLFLVFSALFWKINYLSTRIGWYFLIGFSLMIPILIENTRKRQVALIFVFMINLNLARHFVIPDGTTIVFAPYESYIECKWFGVTPTGKQRAEEYLLSNGGYLRED